MRLVYLSPVPWKSFSQRPQKFVEWFHKRTDGEVLWVDPYPTRFPTLHDLRRLHERASVDGSTRISPDWLKVVEIKALAIEPIPGSGAVNQLFWREAMKQVIDFAKQSKTWLVVGKPSVFALEALKLLRGCSSLYDAMDDFPSFYRGLSKISMARTESLVAQHVDTITVSSEQLKTRWKRTHGDVRAINNGLDLSVMMQVKNQCNLSSRNIFGYVGTIGSWFDWQWICRLAETRPDDEIRLIGPVYGSLPKAIPKNIHFMPVCDHLSALSSMMQFQVGLIPFKQIQLTNSVDPIKYYEYRAFRLPVISTDFGEMRFRWDEKGVFISKSQFDVATVAQRALDFYRGNALDFAFAVENTWEARFDSANLLE